VASRAAQVVERQLHGARSFVGFWYAHEPGPDIKLPCDWHPSLLATLGDEEVMRMFCLSCGAAYLSVGAAGAVNTTS